MGGGGGGGGGGGQGLEFGGGGGGGNSQQAQHDVVTTSMRRNDVASTSFRRRVPTRFLINKCQIITFLILKYIIENSRIELRGIVLPVQVGGLLGGGGPKGYVAPPPLSNYWGGLAPSAPPPPPPPPLPTLMITQYMQCSMLIVVLSISGSKMKIALTDVRSRVRESLAKRLI